MNTLGGQMRTAEQRLAERSCRRGERKTRSQRTQRPVKVWHHVSRPPPSLTLTPILLETVLLCMQDVLANPHLSSVCVFTCSCVHGHTLEDHDHSVTEEFHLTRGPQTCPLMLIGSWDVSPQPMTLQRDFMDVVVSFQSQEQLFL